MTVGPRPQPGPDDAADDEDEDPQPRESSRQLVCLFILSYSGPY
jgi:hypothetical protein